jgi:hypothetical protein
MFLLDLKYIDGIPIVQQVIIIVNCKCDIQQVIIIVNCTCDIQQIM